MSTEENKLIMRRIYEETWNKGNLAFVDQNFAPSYIVHDPIQGVTNDREGMKQRVTMMRTAFPDMHITIEDIITEGDKLVQRWVAQGTHKGELMGIAPTGKQVTITGINISRIVGGKLVEDWTEADMLGMMQQLGVIPPPG
jgi:steroid delta-isomerase-like uncharacterized protein